MIAGYKIAEITNDHIVLAAAANKTITLGVQKSMRRTAGGPWSLGGHMEPGATDLPAAFLMSRPMLPPA